MVILKSRAVCASVTSGCHLAYFSRTAEIASPRLILLARSASPGKTRQVRSKRPEAHAPVSCSVPECITTRILCNSSMARLNRRFPAGVSIFAGVAQFQRWQRPMLGQRFPDQPCVRADTASLVEFGGLFSVHRSFLQRHAARQHSTRKKCPAPAKIFPVERPALRSQFVFPVPDFSRVYIPVHGRAPRRRMVEGWQRDVLHWKQHAESHGVNEFPCVRKRAQPSRPGDFVRRNL